MWGETIRRLAALGTLLVSALIRTAGGAQAAVGTIDSENRFSFVVELQVTWQDGSGSGCSGVILDRVIGTAAHCVWSDEPGDRHGWAKNVTVEYVDVLGIKRSQTSTHFHVPPEYINSASEDEENALYDIAYLVVDTSVDTVGYVHWGSELLAPPFSNLRHQFPKVGAEESPENYNYEIRGKFQASFADVIRDQFDLDNAHAIIVGFGNFACEDFSKREGNCQLDHQRRFVEVPLKSSVQRYQPPQIWCTGQTREGINPVQHGDSGGPVFIQARDGRLVFVGYTSRGNTAWSCASSMFNAMNTWRDVYASRYYIDGYDNNLKDPTRDAEFRRTYLAWAHANSKRFFNEYLERWSSPNEMTLRAFRSLYGIRLYDPKQEASVERLYEQKKDFVARWPKRNYEVKGGTSPTVWCDENHLAEAETKCEVRAEINWEVSNPLTGAKSNGTSSAVLGLGMPEWGSNPLFFNFTTPIARYERGLMRQTSRPSVTFRNIENFDINGKDIRTIKNANIIGCQFSCTEDATCIGFSFDKWNQYCFLKSTAQALSLNPRSVSQIRSDIPEPDAATTPFKMTRYRRKIFPGDGYRSSSQFRFEGCELECQSDNKCVAYTYQKARKDKECNLFAKAGEYHSDPDADSGIKTQAQ